MNTINGLATDKNNGKDGNGLLVTERWAVELILNAFVKVNVNVNVEAAGIITDGRVKVNVPAIEYCWKSRTRDGATDANGESNDQVMMKGRPALPDRVIKT